MYRGHTAGVVIPAYNEERFVADAVASVPGFVDRVYVVDDGSTDDTWREIQAQAAVENDRREAVDGFDATVVPVRHDRNRGVGGAIKTGYLRAREDRVEVTAVMGGDGQMEPEMLGDLFDPIVEGRADYTKGNRFMNRTSSGDMPGFRFVGNAALTALTKVASGYWGSGDPQSGYTAISLRALDEADVEEMYEFYGYCNDLLVKLNVAGMRVADVPRPITYGDEESHIRYRTYVPRVSAMLFRNFLWRLRTNYLAFDFHPLVAAYGLGTLTSFVGVLAFAWALRGVGDAGMPLLRGLVAFLVFLVGVGFLLAATAMDRAANAHLDATRRVPEAPPRRRGRDSDVEDRDRDQRRTSDGEHIRPPAERPDGGRDGGERE